jgi:hypothetical protein
LYQEAHNRNIVQEQLDHANARLLAQFEVQNPEILNLEDQVKKSQAVSGFCREQAMMAGMILPARRSRPVSSRPAMLILRLNNCHINYPWLALIFRSGIMRDFTLEQLQLQNTDLKSSFEQVITLSSETSSYLVSL